MTNTPKTHAHFMYDYVAFYLQSENEAAEDEEECRIGRVNLLITS